MNASLNSSTQETPIGQSVYRIVRSANRAYAFAVLWCYVAAFVVAFALMFVFPPGTLLLVFLGVFGLVLAVGGAQVLGGVEHLLARRLIRRTCCPMCGALESFGAAHASPRREVGRGDRERPDQFELFEHGDRTVCSACGAAFEAWGGEIESIALAGGVRGGSTSIAYESGSGDRHLG